MTSDVLSASGSECHTHQSQIELITTLEVARSRLHLVDLPPAFYRNEIHRIASAVRALCIVDGPATAQPLKPSAAKMKSPGARANRIIRPATFLDAEKYRYRNPAAPAPYACSLK